MKNLTLYLLICAVMLSCKKDEKPTETQKTQEVKFAVSAFEHEVVDFETGSSKQNRISDAAAKDHVNQLALVVYDQSGNEVAREFQIKSAENFGLLKVSLPSGDYTAVVVGSKASFGINKSFEPLKEPYTKYNLAEAYMAYEQDEQHQFAEVVYKTDDTFFKKFKFNVEMDDYGATRKVVLNRIVGKLEFQIEDVETFNVSILNDATAFLFDSERSHLHVDDDESGGWGGGIVNAKNPRSFYMLDTDSPTLVQISSGTKSFIIAVQMYKNKRTIVKGRILDYTEKSPFMITVDDKWSTDSVVVDL